MSVGNPKKYDKLLKLKEGLAPNSSETEDDVTQVYKDPNHRVKKALQFKSGKDKSKLT